MANHLSVSARLSSSSRLSSPTRLSYRVFKYCLGMPRMIFSFSTSSCTIRQRICSPTSFWRSDSLRTPLRDLGRNARTPTSTMNPPFVVVLTVPAIAKPSVKASSNCDQFLGRSAITRESFKYPSGDRPVMLTARLSPISRVVVSVPLSSASSLGMKASDLRPISTKKPSVDIALPCASDPTQQ